MRKAKKICALLLALVLTVMALAACSSGGGGGGDTTAAPAADTETAAPAADTPADTTAAADQGGGAPADSDSGSSGNKVFKIGYAAPFTGVNNDTIVATEFGNNLYLEKIAEMGGIEIAGEKYDIEIIYKDTQSDANVATEVAEQLIVNDKVDLLVGAWTPFTTVPVSAVAERYQQPCVAVNGPVQAWKGDGDYEWCVGLMFDVGGFLTASMDLWDKMDSNKKVGLMYDNSANGVASAEAIPAIAGEKGYTIVDPGRYPADTKDFSTMIDQFISEDVQIIAASMDTATYATFIKQCLQKNYIPQVATGGMACHRLSTVQAVEDIAGEGSGRYVCCEAFWCPDYGYSDEFLEMSVEDIEKAWSEYDPSMPLPEEICFTLATMNLITDVLQKTPSLEKEALRDTLKEGEIKSLFGTQTVEDGNVYYNPTTIIEWVDDDSGEWKYKPIVVSCNQIPQMEASEFIPYTEGK